MRVAVIDVGSNTARLLVAEQSVHGATRVGEAKVYLGLGAEILRRGEIGAQKLAEAAAETKRFAAIASELDAQAIDVFVTAPARQAENGDKLISTIARATGQFVRVLSAQEEGELAYEGALAMTAVDRDPIAVCDVGGGSTEITVGDRKRGAFWSDSVDIGSLRLTAFALHDDPPTKAQLREAEQLVAGLFESVEPPKVKTVLAVGGSARAIAKLVGRRLDAATLAAARDLAVSQPAEQFARATSLDPPRAATLAGGAIILHELTRRLDLPLQLAAGGLREGAAARLLAKRKAA